MFIGLNTEGIMLPYYNVSYIPINKLPNYIKDEEEFLKAIELNQIGCGFFFDKSRITPNKTSCVVMADSNFEWI